MTPGRPRIALVALVAFVVGVGLMVPFEATLTRVGGIAAMAIFVACGLTAIAEPGFLAADRDDE